MAIDVLPDRQYTAPPAADGPSVVLPGVAYTPTGWVELIAAADAALVLTGCVVRPVGTLFTGYTFFVQLAIGAAGFEEDDPPIATWPGFLSEVNASVGADGLKFATNIGIDLIPEGSRLSGRIISSGTDTTTLHISAEYLKKPLVGTMLTTTNPLRCRPDLNDGDFSLSLGAIPVATNATPWVTGTPVELFDDSGPARVVVGCFALIQGAGYEAEYDLCSGVSDDVRTTESLSGGGVPSFHNFQAFEHPLVMPEATRMSVQARDGTVFAVELKFGMAYVEIPL